MKIIPVIDILGGVAVHAVRGMRERYQPLESVLSTSAKPLKVATSFKTLGFNELYVADLDSIISGQLNFSLIRQIVDETGLKLMVDAGIANINRAKELLDCGVSKVIIGTETLTSTSFVSEAIEILGAKRVIVSLDLMGDKVLSDFQLGRLAKPLTFLSELESMGVSQIIVLDLSKVGSREGINLIVLQKALRHKKIEVFVGGGVRDIADLIELKNLGVTAVLIATALHSGKISRENLEQAGLL